MKLVFILFIIFIFFTNFLYSSEIKIATTVNNQKSYFTIGDRIEINYHLIYDSQLKLIEPNIYSHFSNFEILDYLFDSLRTNFRITLTSFEFGDFEIPPITFNFVDTVTNRIYTRLSDCINIKIDSILLSKNSTLKEIENKNLPEYELNYILIFGLILFFAIFSFLLVKFFNSKRNDKES